jgi:antitoxin component YwqK of YwqJK toxin-antitoxin module
MFGRYAKYLCIGLFSVGMMTGCVRKEVCVYQPKLSSIHIVDRNGLSETVSNKDRLEQYDKVNFVSPQPYQKVMRIYGRMPNGDIKATITTYHDNGQIRQYLEIVNNRAFGKYNEWYESGQLKIDAVVIGGEGDIGPSHEKTWVFDNICKAWNYDGCLEAEVKYDKGALEGDTIHYHANGNIWKRISFDKGVLHGSEEIYLQNGDLLQTNEYLNGQKHGNSTRYWHNGTISSQETYRNGKLDFGVYDDLKGTRIATVQDGEGYRALFGRMKLAELHEYRQGELDGEVQVFSENGSLYNSYHMKNGLKHGEEIEYFEMKRYQTSPMPKLSVNWYQGGVQGSVKTWFPNGNQESQRQISKNQKNGLLTAWYEDGSLMMIEEYDHDNLLGGKYFKKGQKLPISKIRDGTGTATIFDSEGNYIRKIQYIKGVPSV